MRFFIVDDSMSAITMIRDPLKELRHEVQYETDSKLALERIVAFEPDCIILDIMMPGIDGLTLCKQLREQKSLAGARIIMVTAKPYEHDRNRAIELGANGYINKLLEHDHLIDRILELAESRFTLKFWGVRGTLPVPGKKTLRYGGNTNCVSLELPTKTLFIFDAGTGIKVLSDELMASKRSPVIARIFISHPHWDHINALPFFAPLYVKGNKFEIYGGSNAGVTMEKMISAQMDGVYFPVTVKEFGADVRYHDLSQGDYTVDGVQVSTLLLKHPGQCLGYRVNCNGQKVCYVSDNELYPRGSPFFDQIFHDHLIEFIKGASVVIADATYRDEEYAPKIHWGHSPVSEVAAVAHEAGVKTLYLYHHDPDQDDVLIDAKLAAARKKLESLDSKTVVEAPAEGTSVRL